MKSLKSLLAVSILLAFAAMIAPAGMQSAAAGEKDPLFVNLVTDDAHGATMALHFAKSMQEQGHPVTVFFNNRGVLVVSKAHTSTYPEQQKEVANLTSGGAVLIACPHCMDYYGVKESGLIGGVVVGSPALLSKQLFLDGTKTLTW